MSGTRRLKTFKYSYDFAVDGGAQGTITLRSNDGALPIGSVVQGGFLDVTTACLSATGTMALQAQSAADLLAAAAQAALTIGVKSLIPVFTGATGIKLTAERNPALVIATAAFTAGKFDLYIQFT
jgi:hypothetical protein